MNFEKWMKKNFQEPDCDEGWGRQDMKNAFNAGSTCARIEKSVGGLLTDAIKMLDKLDEDISHWRKLARQQRVDRPGDFTRPTQVGIDESTYLIKTSIELKNRIERWMKKNVSKKHSKRLIRSK